MVTIDELIDILGVQLRRFLYDNFSSTETLYSAINQTADVSSSLFELVLSTGVQEGSSAKVYYNYEGFNPRYSTLLFKLRLTSIESVFAFIGFKETADNPTFDMTESHAGLMIYNGDVYFSTGNGDLLNPNQQRTRLIGVEPTDVLIWKIIFDKIYYRPTPMIYPYFDGIRAVKTERFWSNPTQNGTYFPSNEDHYFVAYISNTIGADKKIYLNHILYTEEYAD